MDQEEEKQPAPLPIEPGHVMSREKFERLLEEQQK
jgi:hypothetical protein